jgi:type IV pilus assembly protein PilV
MMTYPRPHPFAASQTGASLLEVLIAAFVLAFGLLGIAGLQAAALRNNQSALERSQAVFLTHSILDAIRANLDTSAGATADMMKIRTEYNTAYTCNPSGMASATLAQKDLKRWITNLQYNLDNPAAPSGKTCGYVSCDASTQVCTVKIKWDDSRGTNGASAHEIENRSRL